MNQIIKDRMRGIVTRVRVIHFRLIWALLGLLILGDSNAVWAQCRAHPEIVPPIESVANTLALSTSSTASTPDIVALTTDNTLLRFNSADPTKIFSQVQFLPDLLPSHDSLVALDFNPADGRLYVLSSTGRMYFINDYGISGPMNTGYGSFFSNHGTKFGIDFDPTRGATGVTYKPWRGTLRVVT